jgi:hypothetical protein
MHANTVNVWHSYWSGSGSVNCLWIEIGEATFQPKDLER